MLFYENKNLLNQKVNILCIKIGNIYYVYNSKLQNLLCIKVLQNMPIYARIYKNMRINAFMRYMRDQK